MAAEIKFCGMMRAEDALEAALLGATYVGVIFAPGPRRLTTANALAVLAGVPADVRTVGVFSDHEPDLIVDAAKVLGLRVIQLHGARSASAVQNLRGRFNGEIWSVLRVAEGQVPDNARELFAASDAVLVDAYVPGKLGGTGVALPWAQLRDPLDSLRKGSGAKLVLAGGLRPENVKEAIRQLAPDVVDVSSGVEVTPGIKDHARMRAFRDAVNASQ